MLEILEMMIMYVFLFANGDVFSNMSLLTNHLKWSIEKSGEKIKKITFQTIKILTYERKTILQEKLQLRLQ